VGEREGEREREGGRGGRGGWGGRIERGRRSGRGGRRGSTYNFSFILASIDGGRAVILGLVVN